LVGRALVGSTNPATIARRDEVDRATTSTEPSADGHHVIFHFHNLIFGLRQEARGDMDILGPLDIDPC
jgi:hypothetical protein